MLSVKVKDSDFNDDNDDNDNNNNFYSQLTGKRTLLDM